MPVGGCRVRGCQSCCGCIAREEWAYPTCCGMGTSPVFHTTYSWVQGAGPGLFKGWGADDKKCFTSSDTAWCTLTSSFHTLHACNCASACACALPCMCHCCCAPQYPAQPFCYASCTCYDDDFLHCCQGSNVCQGSSCSDVGLPYSAYEISWSTDTVNNKIVRIAEEPASCDLGTSDCSTYPYSSNKYCLGRMLCNCVGQAGCACGGCGCSARKCKA